jgi:hypothetical protein
MAAVPPWKKRRKQGGSTRLVAPVPIPEYLSVTHPAGGARRL